MMDNKADKPDYETRSRKADKFAKIPSYSTAKNNCLEKTELSQLRLQMLRQKPHPSKIGSVRRLSSGQEMTV
ncbi:hypothetical protein FQN53_001780 [Emmonsiellopsis sp. PD_33]|nr:hypothetical protein FQN53_001780 [Emmonsiellopsis sp. PD_33]